jgi:ribonuclease D
VSEPVLLTEPREGIPPVISDSVGLSTAIAALAGGTGPVAIDAERASGFRYGQRAYLIQLRRQGSGTWLIDPIGFPSLALLHEAIADEEWILHSSLQDLPCMRELELIPTRLFDTELAARILGRPKVGLAALVESELGLILEKGHSAADWSTRPLPESWVRYAALDVEVLIELRDLLHTELIETGRWEWAQAEFAHITSLPMAEPRKDPWRRTSGMHRLRKPRQLAIIRELWTVREHVARERDVSPGRIVNDDTLVAIASAPPASSAEMHDLPGFRRRGASRHVTTLWSALQGALALPDEDLPLQNPPSDGPPPPRIWRERDPQAAVRLAACREEITQIAEALGMPPEVLIPPESVRQLAWRPPDELSVGTVSELLASHGARTWQITLVADALETALCADPENEELQEVAESDSVEVS